MHLLDTLITSTIGAFYDCIFSKSGQIAFTNPVIAKVDPISYYGVCVCLCSQNLLIVNLCKTCNSQVRVIDTRN